MMPSDGHWQINGTHYQKTSKDWLRNMDAAKKTRMPLLAETYGAGQAKSWWVRWRIFFLACAELWGYRKGTEWLVSHFLLEKTRLNTPV